MTHAIVMREPGGPEVLKWEEVATPEPGQGEIRINQSAAGLNYIDCYHRTGLYPLEYPATIGMEGAGTIDAIGDGVTNLSVGDRVAYASAPPGAYTQSRVIAADRVVALPDSISDDTGAAMMLQGMTVQYLIRTTYPVKSGDTVLLHAAAGGVGLIACQWLKQLGATIIGTVGSDEKAALAKAHGCDHTIVYTRENFTDRVREITNGAGVPVVYDSIGKDTFEGSMDCLAPLGMFVSFGNASGPLEPFNPGILAAKGSLFFTRPSLVHYTAKAEDLKNSAKDLIGAIEKGLKIEINQTYPLKDAAEAHRALEARETTGSTIFKT
jgi:NADPH:quinone reductase